MFTGELTAQLADARSTTTAKLDAPVNKLARLLNSPSIKRVLLNDSLRIDFDSVISGEEVLVVKGALGAMGAGNTAVLMQLLVGMLDASLARQQDLVGQAQRVAVALKVDEAPLVLNRGFAETMALKRSAGLETVACWQTDAQWVDREVRDQLDALFAHRVYFATASARDARAAVALTMAEFSDTIRPGIEHLSALGRPDVRLHLPKHHAIASWATPAGRQAPFVAQTIPLSVDCERLALHAARQLARGGTHRADLRQPHWDRHRAGPRHRQEPPGPSSEHAVDPPRTPMPAPGAAPTGSAHAPAPALPESAAASYGELVALDGAASVRWAKPLASLRKLDLDLLDLEILTLIARLRHVLTSQIHRRFNAGRAATTTQRRLKRLADAGMVQRLQFHRPDGGGVPMCCMITAEGLQLLHAEGRLESSVASAGAPGRAAATAGLADREGRLRQARHEIHVAGWALALDRAVGGGSTVRGPEESALYPPERTSNGGRTAFGPADLRLPGGRAPHDFLRTDAAREKIDVERFETVRPDAIVEVDRRRVPARGSPGAEVGEPRAQTPIDVFVELDDRRAGSGAVAKLERYDHFLAGWSVHTSRYGRRLEALPLVAFVCRDRARARDCARAADAVLRACRAYAGEYPFDWEYPGRRQIVFASERDLHEGFLHAYGIPTLPPEVRVVAAHGDPSAGEAAIEPREIM